MPALDIFNDDAFGLVPLTKAINDIPHKPGRLGQLGYFNEEGINATSVMIERVGTSLQLVSTAERGSPPPVVVGDKRKLVSMPAVHLPQRAVIRADEVVGLRAFGSETEHETVMNVLTKRLVKMRTNIDVTLEYQRMGAVKGQVLDADGSVLWDMFTTFDLTKTTHSLALGTAGTKVAIKVIEAKRKMEAALGGLMYSGIRVLCSQTFFDALVSHAAVEKAYDRWMNGEFLRTDNRSGFFFAGVFWEEYVGKVGATDFIESGKAHMIPEGVSDLFTTNFAPADYLETVNTNGLPYYAKQRILDFDKGVEVESQSNPLHICTRPNAIVELSA